MDMLILLSVNKTTSSYVLPSDTRDCALLHCRSHTPTTFCDPWGVPWRTWRSIFSASTRFPSAATLFLSLP